MKTIIKNTKVISISLIAATILGGCSAKDSSWNFQNNFEKGISNLSDDNNITLDGKKMPNILNNYENKENPNFLSMENSISLSTALKKISKIDGRKYFLHRDAQNIILPSANIKVNSFNDLRLYIEDTLEKTIFISKNAIIKDRPKIIKVQDIGEKKWDLRKVAFDLNTEISVKDALQKLSTTKEFQFSISIDHDDFGINDNKIFQETYVNFKGKTVSSFFKYLEEKLNIYIDIDYENKIAHIHKYKRATFNLNIGNLKMTVSGEADTEVTSDGEAQKNAIQESIKVDIYSEIEEHFKTLVQNSKSKGNNRTYYALDKQTGIVSIYADKETVEQFESKIEHINDAYKDMIEVEIISFDIIFSKNYLFQTGISVSTSKNNKAVSYGLASSVANTINSVFSFNDEKDDKKTSFMFESLQNIGFVANKKTDRYVMRNHIPDSDSTLETERYIKNVTFVGETENQAASQTTETDIIKKPEGYSITAHHSNGMISLDIRDYRGQLLSMGELNTGTTTVSNPKTKSNEAVKHIYIKDSDAIIVKNQTSIASAKDYNGLVPTDWLATNVLGGGSNEDILYTQNIKIITAKKINKL